MEPSKWGMGEWIAYGFGGFILLIIAVALVASVVMVVNKRPAARQPANGGALPQPAAGQAGAQPAPARSFKGEVAGVAKWVVIFLIVGLLLYIGWSWHNSGSIPKIFWWILFALIGGWILWKGKGWFRTVGGLILIAPLLVTIWSGPDEGARLADNLGKTVTGVSDGLGKAGEKISELGVPETLRTKGEIELGENEEKEVTLTSEPREISYAVVGQCFGADPIDQIGFKKISPGKGELWSKVGERKFTIFTRIKGTCPT